jgi:3-dehydroquinate synthase
MHEISLLSSKILVAPGLVDEAGRSIRELAPRASKAFVLTDRRCAAYAKRVAKGMEAAGLPSTTTVLPPGESQKRLATAARLYDALARAGADRRTPLVAVGGGVITDLGGFVAATFMRGLPAFLLPTTLLGQVDAAIGGKTGINLPQGKNLVGTFTQPAAVFLDPEALATLPERDYVSGLGEVVKYGMIRDAALFARLERDIDAVRRRDPALLAEVVRRCAEIKADVVGRDEREGGLRAILNYGHTIGHALEAAGGYRVLQHGEAVAVGMEGEAYIALELGMVDVAVLAAQNRLLKLCGLPTRARRLPRTRVLSALRLDKKSEGGRPRFVLPEAVGRVRHGIEVAPELVLSALRAVTV